MKNKTSTRIELQSLVCACAVSLDDVFFFLSYFIIVAFVVVVVVNSAAILST